MPTVTINFLKGRTLDQKREMVKRVTDALVDTIHCTRDHVHIELNEISKEDVANGGVLVCDEER
ncbi:2-hydroxymuconate tautomerase [Zophobihabitans entericus]|uniref:4-oxalocrotonate tautomerase n=1 Tax=Zophobihabitans entericus TaxID=1635327 RepID=A0A6G9IAD8_9GAMM|nr:2-hydroxymuconate tautomerase [Zophobihabitans entericus]QIQ21198.1 4-oxalocrotonate tautomerase [Zophobihabitans entericus]